MLKIIFNFHLRENILSPVSLKDNILLHSPFFIIVLQLFALMVLTFNMENLGVFFIY
jgi:hypothetical protein